jgi:nitroreductase
MLRKILRKIKLIFFILLSTNKWFTGLYYFINPKGFQHEQYGVFSGIMKNRTDISNIGNFRRDIHRIEKGLITKPPKSFFAENYILKTILTYKSLLNSNCDNPTLIWAAGVLNQYFETVEKTSVILKAFEEFQKTKTYKNDILPKTCVANTRKKSTISIDEFFKLNKQRRSIRYYQKKQVPRNIIESAIRVALQSPSACNRQPFNFRIIDDPDLVKIAAQLPMGAATFSENIPVMIFIIGDLSNYFDERDKHLIYLDGALAAMNFILALETQGLSSCIIHWSDIHSNNKKLKIFLDLKDWEQCIMTISVGFALPECGIPSSVKKDVKTVTKYN